MRVGLITAQDATVVWLVRGVDVTVFLAIGRVRKTPITAGVLAFKRLFSCNNTK